MLLLSCTLPDTSGRAQVQQQRQNCLGQRVWWEIVIVFIYTPHSVFLNPL